MMSRINLKKAPSSVALMVLLLAGCTTPAAITCPSLPTYSKSFQAEASREIDRIESEAPRTMELLQDYSKMRDAVRACRRHLSLQ